MTPTPSEHLALERIHAETGFDLERIRFVTRNFRLLQGLRIKVPMGLLLVAHGASDLVGLGLHGAFLSGALGVFLSTKPAAYYRRRFGEVERPDRRFFTVTNPWALAAALLFVHGNLAWAFGGASVRPVYVVCGALLIWLWFEAGHSPRLFYYPLLGALALAVAAPNATFGYLLPTMGSLAMSNIFAGAVLVLVGLLDHRQLVVGMPRLPQTAEFDEATAEAIA